MSFIHIVSHAHFCPFCFETTAKKKREIKRESIRSQNVSRLMDSLFLKQSLFYPYGERQAGLRKVPSYNVFQSGMNRRPSALWQVVKV